MKDPVSYLVPHRIAAKSAVLFLQALDVALVQYDASLLWDELAQHKPTVPIVNILPNET